MNKHHVISLNRLRKARQWYERPITIKIAISFKKSTIIILLLITLCIYLLTRQHAQALGIIKPPYYKVSKGGTTLSLVPSFKNPSQDLVDHFQAIQDKIEYNRRLAIKRRAEALKKAQEAVLKAQKAKEARLKASFGLTSIQPVKVIAPVYHAPSVVGNCGDNQYANFIYMHESGCNLNSVNSIGCRGIGQACPGSKLPCGADYACQNAWFTNYAIRTYGSWQGAYNAWISKNWW